MKRNQKYFSKKKSYCDDVEILEGPIKEKEFSLNIGQLEAIDRIEQWLNDKYSKFFGLIGRAGTGKSYSLGHVRFPPNLEGQNPSTIGVAPTHKAKDILTASLKIPCITVATLIFAKIKYIESQEVFESDRRKWKNALPYKVIIIDEASMLDSDTIEIIKQIYPKSKILFVGDSGQLSSILEPKYSIFDHIDKVELTENMRSGEDNGLLELANLNYKSEDVFLGEFDNVEIVDSNMYVDLFKKKKIDAICCYTNKAKDFINKKVHDAMFPLVKYGIGEIMISNENVGAVEEKTEVIELGEKKITKKITYNIYNSELLKITSVSEPHKHEIVVYKELWKFIYDSFGIPKKDHYGNPLVEFYNTDYKTILDRQSFTCHTLTFEKRDVFTGKWVDLDYKPNLIEESDIEKFNVFVNSLYKLALSKQISWESYHKYKKYIFRYYLCLCYINL